MPRVAAVAESYLKVQYDLRPAKQVERRMLVDALHMLAMAGFPVRDYQYTGFGSIYFVDFVLFHKLLGIRRMVSVEHSTKVKKRVDFNKPYAFVDVVMGSAADVIPRLSADVKHLLWLDYDSVLSAGQISDVRLAGTYLSPGSLLLVTVDVEPPGSADDGPKQWKEHFHNEAGELALSFDRLSDFAESNLININVRVLARAIEAGLSGRDVSFFPLFNFLYADGHRMLTIGGMIVTDAELRRIKGSQLMDTHFIRRDLRKAPYSIRIPRVTRKERLYLDSMMPCAEGWKPEPFEMLAKDVAAYREIYPFFPAYAELLL